MKIKEIIQKNLITILGILMSVLPAILEEVAKYVPVEYSSLFGIIVIVVGKIYQMNNFDTVKSESDDKDNIEEGA